MHSGAWLIQASSNVLWRLGETEGLGARLVKCEAAATTASTLAASIPGEIAQGLQKFEAKTVRGVRPIERCAQGMS